MSELTTIRGRSADGGFALEVSFTEAGIVAVDTTALAAGESLPILAPGFIDTQVNGFAGVDVNADDLVPEMIVELTARLAQIGVTTWLPTIITASEDKIAYALEQIRRAREQNPVVRNAIPSAHVEGPFISDHDGARGVHDAGVIRPLDADEVARWLERGPLGMVTVSPHTPDAAEHIRRIVAMGVAVSIGHTHASPAQIRAAADAGARFSTHLGNGIPSLLPRHPNALWTQLADDRLSAGLIADGHHLPMDTLEVMLRAKTISRAYLVSDLTAIGGSAPGRYVTAVGGLVELDATNRLSYVGTEFLAGAASTIVDGLRNVITGTTLSTSDALALVTSSAAGAAIGGRSGLGHLVPGGPADFVLIDGLDAEPHAGSSAPYGTDLRISRVIQSGRAVG